MKNLFIGFIFVFLNFNLSLGDSSIGLLPSFVGYFFILKGLRELEGRTPYFDKLHSATTAMLTYSAILYIFDLIGITAKLSIFVSIFAMISVLGSLYISRSIVVGVKELETSMAYYMKGDFLFSKWKLMAFLNIVSILMLIVPIINLICIIASFVANVLFLLAFNQSKNMYYARQNSTVF